MTVRGDSTANREFERRTALSVLLSAALCAIASCARSVAVALGRARSAGRARRVGGASGGPDRFR